MADLRFFKTGYNIFALAVVLGVIAVPAAVRAQDQGAVPTTPVADVPVIDTNEPASEPEVDDLIRKIEESSDVAPAPSEAAPALTPEPPAAAVDQGAGLVPLPDDAGLTDAGEEVLPTGDLEIVPVTPEEAAPPPAPADSVAAEDVPVVPSLPAGDAVAEDVFFDAESLVPEGEMGVKAGPKTVDPRLQPGSKLIVVKKDYAPSSRQAQLISADRAIQLGRYDSALAIYDALYAKNRKDPRVLMGRAVALQHLGEDEAAIHAYEDLLNVQPDDVEAQVNMLGLLGKHYPAVALERLKGLYEQSPNNINIVAQMAVLYAALGQYDEALQSLGIAAGIEPNNANHLYNIAVIADRAGKKKEAINYYEQALETDAVYGGSRTIPRDAVFERLAQLR